MSYGAGWETLYLLLASDVEESVVPTLTREVIAGPTVRLTWEDAVADEIGYSIERRDVTAAGAFAEVATVGPGIEVYDDVGPFTAGHIYQWRIVVIGGSLDGEESNVVTAFRKIAVISGGHLGFRIGLGL